MPIPRLPRLLVAALLLYAGLGFQPAAAQTGPAARPPAQPAAPAVAPADFGPPYLVEDLTTTGFPEGGEPTSFAFLPGAIFFVADTPATGRELYRTDGTFTGTVQIAELYPGDTHGVDYPTFGTPLATYDGRVYFSGDSAHFGAELWASDGTLTGTVLVRDIATGTERADPELFVDYQGELYFIADDEVNGRELWKTDGTLTGTVLAVDIDPGSGGVNLDELVAYDGRLWFENYDPGGYEPVVLAL